jgi:hypothetical protein
MVAPDIMHQPQPRCDFPGPAIDAQSSASRLSFETLTSFYVYLVALGVERRRSCLKIRRHREEDPIAPGGNSPGN